ncbi:MAG TPA: addiction module protein [Thermoanaerobaculia bacterium]
MSRDDLEREALKLPADERAEFAYNLLQSVDENPEHERLWKDEIERRCREIDEGKATLIPADEVLAKLRAKLK